MSFSGKKWVIQNEDTDLPLVEKLLLNRQIDSLEKREQFLGGSFEDLFDPFLLKDMGKAVERIGKALKNHEKIMIFGDYDVDGMSATAVLYDFFKKQGADVCYTLPHREEDGYGLKDYFIRRFKEGGVDLVITVDCGTSNLEEITLANQLGIEVIVTDHHSMPEVLPPATALINPKQPACQYPNKELSGSGIAYKLVAALAETWIPEAEREMYLRKELSVAALGLVADCMCLLNFENRVMVKEGLNGLMAGLHPGISTLLKEIGVSSQKISSLSIGFQIGPRLNAAGRLDKPDHALELLLGNLDKAVILNSLNKQRQLILEAYMKEVIAYLEQLKTVPNIIVLLSKEWKSGLLGLIASRVVDSYHRPAIIMQDKGDELVASMRSVNDFDITGTMREAAGDLFASFGGHKGAGGFTLPKENLHEFLKRVETTGNEKIQAEDFMPMLSIDCEIQSEEVSMQTCDKMARLEPFGQNNPEPVLMLKNVKLRNMRPVGSQGEHLQFPVEIDQKTFSAIAFRFSQHLGKIDPNVSYDVAFRMEINEWKGNKKVQLNILDLKPSEQ